MTFKRPYSAGLAALAVGLFAATAAYAEPTVNKGDNAWMLTSTVLVLLMTIPGLALFYGGLVRSKNMLSVLMQVFYTVCIVIIIWALYGYSLAFTGGSDFIGGFSKAFLMGVTPDSKAATFSIDAITTAAKTGQIGDGKIFVINLDHAVRIRTGEADAAAL